MLRFRNSDLWEISAECFNDRTDVQCLHRWQKILNPELLKGPWSKEEDEIIVQLVNKYGPKKWSTIAQHLPGRIGKQMTRKVLSTCETYNLSPTWFERKSLTLCIPVTNHLGIASLLHNSPYLKTLVIRLYSTDTVQKKNATKVFSFLHLRSMATV